MDNILELCRLAQQGDQDAQKALDDWWHTEVEQQEYAVDPGSTYTVGDYIAEALSMGENDLDYDEDLTASDVCRP